MPTDGGTSDANASDANASAGRSSRRPNGSAEKGQIDARPTAAQQRDGARPTAATGSGESENDATREASPPVAEATCEIPADDAGTEARSEDDVHTPRLYAVATLGAMDASRIDESLAAAGDL